jgi:hypothetical protein
MLLARFGKILVYGALVIGGLGAIAFVADALRQQARATRQTATAATVAATGQTANSVGQTVLAVLLLVVLLTAAVAIGYLWLRLRRAEQRAGYHQPRDHRGRLISTQAEQSVGYEPQMDVGQSLNMLLQMELLRSMRELRNPQQPQPTQIAIEDYGYDEEETTDDGLWGW